MPLTWETHREDNYGCRPKPEGEQVMAFDPVYVQVPDEQTERAFCAVRDELARAAKWGPLHSLHDAYAHILEELDEVWEHVKMKQHKRDLDAARQELVQVAAMAIKAIEVIDSGRGRV